MYAETIHQIWFQGGGRGKPLRPEAVWNRYRVRYCTHGKASSRLEGQEVTTDCEQSSLLSVREEERWWRAIVVKYLQQKIQDRKVASQLKFGRPFSKSLIQLREIGMLR